VKYQFDKDVRASQSWVTEVEYYVINDKSGLPDCFMELTDDGEFYGVHQGDKLQEYKIGYHLPRNIEKVTDYFKLWLSNKFKSIMYTHVCFYTVTDDEEFQYRTGPDGVHLGYAFQGAGFKFLPMHGKIILEELILKGPWKYSLPDQEAKL
jgi:hypothetical protein